jgi:membrane-associated phospholipid phosphatase
LAGISNKEGIRGALIICAIGLACHLTTFGLSRVFDAPFSWWFSDTLLLNSCVLANTLMATYVYDALLFCVGIVVSIKHPTMKPADYWRPRSLARLGVWPHIWFAITAYWMLMTSNVMLMSVNLVDQGITQWNDATLWRIEQPLFAALSAWAPPTFLWDVVYNACWSLSLTGAFLLLVITRSGKSLLPLLGGMIFVFYTGRLIGLISPMLGPAFFKPEYFAYLDGSLSKCTMRAVERVIDRAPDVLNRSGVLIGGISAMPSLHTSLVLMTSYWLFIHDRRTLFYTIPWAMVGITSTVVLGWHYALDSAGSVLLVAFCALLTHLVFRYPFHPPMAKLAAATKRKKPARKTTSRRKRVR